MSVKTRFAPSPTGMLHVGNVRTSLINWLFTRKMGGVFMLRMDDTDLLRSKPEYEQAIKNDLQWLGLNWDEFAKQSDRLARYEEIKQKLIQMGRLYPCYESQAELDMKRKMQLSRGLPPIYDRAGLNDSANGRKAHYRFLLNNEKTQWDDLIRGNIEFQGKNLSDPIVIREDGSMTYILCSAIDDIDFAITHILRGEDHITNTAIGIQITKALGFEPPKMGHLSLLQSKTGEISKRIGGFDISSLRDKFIEPMAINSLLAKMGSSDATEAVAEIEELIEQFDVNKFSSSAVNYDLNELIGLNHKLISVMSYEQIATSLNRLPIKITPEFWYATRGNLSLISEINIWWNVCYDEVTPNIAQDVKEFLGIACNLLPENQWNENTWGEWMEKVKHATGRSGKQLFMPIRLALTALEYGPELKLLLPIIGREKVEKRLNGETA